MGNPLLQTRIAPFGYLTSFACTRFKALPLPFALMCHNNRVAFLGIFVVKPKNAVLFTKEEFGAAFLRVDILLLKVYGEKALALTGRKKT